MTKNKELTLLNDLFCYNKLGRLVDFTPNKEPVIEVITGKHQERVVARSCIKLNAKQLGAEVVFLITDSKPVIMGVIENEPVEIEVEETTLLPKNVIKVDGQVLELKAKEQISLQ